MKEPKVKILTLRDSCGGVEMHWDKPPGDSLQGYYPSRTKARKAAKLLEEFGVQLDLGPKVSHDSPPPGYAPCTRDPGHDGPCAHHLKETPDVAP